MDINSVKSIEEVEEFDAKPGDIADYSEVSDDPIPMDDKFLAIFNQLVSGGAVMQLDKDDPTDIKIVSLLQTKIPNNYGNYVYYIKDADGHYHKVALLDFYDDDCFVFCKLDKEVDPANLRKVIPPKKK